MAIQIEAPNTRFSRSSEANRLIKRPAKRSLWRRLSFLPLNFRVDGRCASMGLTPQHPLHYPKPMKVSAQYAQEHFADLAIAAANGEEVEIEVYGQPTLVLLQRRTPIPFRRTTPRILGEGIGEMTVPDWDEWKAIDREMEREVINHPLVPGEL